MKAVAIGGYTSGEKFIAGCLPSDIVIHLDGGHGTRLYNSVNKSPDGRYYEGEFSRLMVKKAAKAFEEMGFNVFIVTPEDNDISLPERCRRANAYMKAHPDKYHIFISFHSDAEPKETLGKDGWGNARGMGVHIAPKASEASKILASNVYDAAMAMGLKGNRSGSGPKVNPWTVITDTKMPAILTESAFHTNKKDVDFLLSEAGQETVVNYHVAGVCKTFGIPYSLVKA